LTNQDDQDVQPFIIGDFAALCQNAREICMHVESFGCGLAATHCGMMGKEAFTDSHGKFPSLAVQETELLCSIGGQCWCKRFQTKGLITDRKACVVIASDVTYNVAEIFKDRSIYLLPKNPIKVEAEVKVKV
jgi:hypothetical protein